jgi:hypothetical protein
MRVWAERAALMNVVFVQIVLIKGSIFVIDNVDGTLAA